MSTKIQYKDGARQALKKGVDMVADAVKVSLGAEGRNVVIPHQSGAYIITKDGVSIARQVHPEDEFELIGASLIKEAAHRTNVQAGDGTTTATVIAQYIFDRGLRLLENSRVSSVELKRGIDKATKDIVDHLDDISTKVSKYNLENVATISANGDEELGRLISEAFNKIGEHGTVITEISDTAETYVELREGVQLDRGLYHPIFQTDTIKEICELENPFILLNRGKIEKGDGIIKLFDQVFKKGSLLIFTDDIDPFVLSAISQNIKSGAIYGKVCVVRSPQIFKINKYLMDDIAVLTGATVVDEKEGSKLDVKNLGQLRKAVISEKDSILVGDANNLNGLVEDIKTKISITKNVEDKKELQERLSRITGGVATLYVGAKSDSELKERLDRVEDSINATRSALEEGIVPGGGVALMNGATILDSLRDFKKPNFLDKLLTFLRIKSKPNVSSFDYGYRIALESFMSPINQILTNAGMDRIEPGTPLWGAKFGEGIDVKTGETVNMIEKGIIDPKKVTRCAVENACSVAGTFLTTEAVIARN